HVGPAVLVDVADGCAHAFSEMAPDLRLRRDVAERSVAVVPEQLIRERRVLSRMAVGPTTGRTLAAKRLTRGIPGAVIHDEQIQPAVSIEIEPGCESAPHRHLLLMRVIQASLRRVLAVLVVSQ